MTRPASDARNVFTGRRETLFRCYVATVTIVGLAVLCRAAAALDVGRVPSLGPAFWAVVGLVILAEVRPLFTAGSRDVNGISISTAFVFAALLRFGLPVAVVLQACATFVADIVNRKAPWRTAFNIAQYSLSWGAASAVLQLLDRDAGVADPRVLTAGDLPAVLLAGLAYFGCNQILVALAIGLRTGQSWHRIVREDLRHETLVNGTLLGLSPLVVLAATSGAAFLPLLLPPLVAVHLVGHIALAREQQARTDLLTGLPNRHLLAVRAEQALREPESPFVALVLLDLDRFKEVNDTLGHHVGDRLLQVVATRLAEAVRPADTVARLGGDEFAVLLTEVSDADDAVAAAARLAEVVAAPILLEGLLVDVGVSVGVAVSPGDGVAVDELLQRADVAMYLAKESGGGVERYDAARDRNSTSRLAMLGELRRAIAEGELELHYQPKADLRSGRVVGVEALVRWRHPVRGLVPPDDFVPLAERTGLIVPLTAWVLRTAVAQLVRWHAAGLDLRLAVNVSAKDLAGPELAATVAECMTEFGLDPSLLDLEVTEGSLLADPTRTAATLRRLAALGVSLSLDDFGTGYSSLGHLSRLPVREIKIDRSFVQRMESDARDLAIVHSVVDLAAGLGLGVVAEGVETASAWEALAAMGCGTAQGYFLSRPLPPELLTPWLQDRSSTRRSLPVQAAPTPAS